MIFQYEKFVTANKPERSLIMKLEQALAAVKGEKAAELFKEMYVNGTSKDETGKPFN